MPDQIAIQVPRPRVMEGSAFTATAYFRNRATSAASAPSAVRWRVDCLTTGREVVGWTSATAAASITISVPPAANAIHDDANFLERRQLVVEADAGLSTQERQAVTWEVKNIRGI